MSVIAIFRQLTSRFVSFRVADYSRTGCVVTQLGLGCEASWVRGIANAPGLHIDQYRAEPA